MFCQLLGIRVLTPLGVLPQPEALAVCGIAGYARVFSSPLELEDEAVLARMTAALEHRGPDAEGYLIRDRVAMGHRRLAIIDIAGGAQRGL